MQVVNQWSILNEEFGKIWHICHYRWEFGPKSEMILKWSYFCPTWTDWWNKYEQIHLRWTLGICAQVVEKLSILNKGFGNICQFCHHICEFGPKIDIILNIIPFRPTSTNWWNKNKQIHIRWTLVPYGQVVEQCSILN